MNMIATPTPPLPQTNNGRRRLRFTPQEYWFLCEQGMVPERSELVDGEIFEMPAQFWPAVRCIGDIEWVLKHAWHDRRLVGNQGTHVFASGWQPLPDLVVYDVAPPNRPGPGVIFPPPRLVVEVADETLDYDLGEKARRYAAQGVEELWVADVKARRLHVHREANAGEWRLRLLLKPGDAVTPFCLPDAKLAVADLLPDLYPPG